MPDLAIWDGGGEEEGSVVEELEARRGSWRRVEVEEGESEEGRRRGGGARGPSSVSL